MKELCKVFEVSRSGYYAWRKRAPSEREEKTQELCEEIRKIHQESWQTYGRHRVREVLKMKGIECGHNRVGKLMRGMGIQGVQKKRYRPKTTIHDHNSRIWPNALKEIGAVVDPGRVWVGDITYIETKEGWRYLSAVMDLGSRRVLGWRFDNHMMSLLIEDAFRQALGRGNYRRGLVHHSDQGSQYGSESFRGLMKEHGVVGSMSSRGNCYENAAMESFWGTLKTELMRGRVFESEAQARMALFEYIEIFYNRQRLHSSLGYKSPIAYEQEWRDKQKP